VGQAWFFVHFAPISAAIGDMALEMMPDEIAGPDRLLAIPFPAMM